MLVGEQDKMNNFLSKEKMLRKSGELFLVLTILVSALFFFDFKKEFLLSFKPYYVQAYVPQLGDLFLFGKSSQLASVKNFDSAVSVSTNSKIINNAKSIPVLLYHGLVKSGDMSNVSLEMFIDQMVEMKKKGWDTVTIDEFYDFMTGKVELPDKSFLLTFDDGRKDSFYPADPVLEKLGYNAVIFAITSRVDSQANHLTIKEMNLIQNTGRWDIQSHGNNAHDLYEISLDGTKGNFLTNKLWNRNENRLETEVEYIGRIEKDFSSSKLQLQKWLNKNVIGYAYPFGDFGYNSQNFIDSSELIFDSVEMNYKMSFYQVWTGLGNSFNYPNSRPFYIKRISVNPIWSGTDLLDILNSLKHKELPYQLNIFNISNGWQRNWGELEFDEGKMITRASESTSGSTVFLDGTHAWKNYEFHTQVDWISGKSFSLVARHADDDNYVACNYQKDSLSVEEVINGESRIVSSLKIKGINHGYSLNVGLKVSANTIDCLWGNEFLGGVLISRDLNYGGIGFKSWGKESGLSEISIRKISVFGESASINDFISSNKEGLRPKHGLTE